MDALPNTDYHIHTEYCHHNSGPADVGEIIRRANDMDLDTIAITEHYTYPGHIWRINRIRKDISEYESFTRIMLGAELDINIMDDNFPIMAGTIPHQCKPLLLSIHPMVDPRKLTSRERDDRVRRYFAAFTKNIETKKFDVLTHPGAYLSTIHRSGNFVDADILRQYAELFCCCQEHNVAIELNEQLFHFKLRKGEKENYPNLMESAKSHGVKFSLASDAHRWHGIGSFHNCRYMAKSINLTADDFILFN